MKGKTIVRMALLWTFLLTSSLLLAQGETETEPGSTMRLAWWGNPTRDERTLEVVQRYMQDHPDVTIETETTGWSGYWDKMNTQAAAGSLPDLLQQSYTYILQWAKRGQLLDLTPYVENGTIDLDNVDATFLDGGMIDGKLYAVSLGTNAFCIAYDPAILEAAGIESIDSTTWTWDDFERIANRIYRTTGVRTIPFSTVDPEVPFDNMNRQAGYRTYGDDGDGLGFSDPSILREYFAIQMRLKKSGALLDPATAYVNVTPAESPLAKGTSWCEFLWSNQFVAFGEAAARPLEMALLPRITDSKRYGTFMMPSMFFSISASAGNPDEAARFLNFFLNDLAANDILAGERGVPIPSDVRNHLAQNVTETNKQIFSFIDLAAENSSPIDPPSPPKSGEFLKMFRDTALEILLERTTIDKGVEIIMDEGNSILE